MQTLLRSGLAFLGTVGLATACMGQAAVADGGSAQVVEKAVPAVALVLVGQTMSSMPNAVGTALAVRQDGVLLTAYHLVRNAHAVQVRLKSGETFDQVQLVGVDERRDVAAIRIAASGLVTLPVASVAEIKPGEPVVTVSHPEALPWSASSGVVSAVRMADEVPGAGKGFRVIQFSAPTSPGSSGGVLVDTQGRAVGLIVGSLEQGQNLNFAVPVESVVGLANGAVMRSFASGAALQLPKPGTLPMPSAQEGTAAVIPATPGQPEKSELLKDSRDADYILRNFKTMFVNCDKASFFGSEQMKAALVSNPDFAALNITVVSDPGLADTILVVGYTFAWDYPFTLVHQNTSTMLVAGKGSGPFSGPAGATSVAKKLIALLQPYRTGRPQKR